MKKNLLIPAIVTVLFVSVFASCKKADPEVAITKTTTTSAAETVDSLKLGLLAYYPFNNSGADESGNGNTGSIYNITASADRNGKANAAYYFDGISSYVSVKDTTSLRLNNTDFTLNAWIKASSYNVSTGSLIFSKRTPGVNNSGWIWSLTGSATTPTGVMSFGPGSTSSATVINAFGTKVVTINAWHMITTVYTLSTQKLSIYIDGVLDNTTTSVASPNGTVTNMLYIGRDSSPNTYYFQGSMDDLRIYSRALPVSQIKQLLTVTY